MLPTTYVITSSGCWQWTGYVDRNGYARCYDRDAPRGRRTEWAHRAYYRRHVGPIPPDHEIDHVCQNTRCVNPDHLDAVTKAEHAARTMRRLGKDARHRAAAVLRSLGMTYSDIADALGMADRSSAHDSVRRAISKGLIDPSAVPPATRLTPDEVEDIRDLYALGVPQTELAAWYRVDSSQISRICSGARHRRAS